MERLPLTKANLGSISSYDCKSWKLKKGTKAVLKSEEMTISEEIVMTCQEGESWSVHVVSTKVSYQENERYFL